MRTIVGFKNYTTVLPVAVLVTFSVGVFVLHFYVNGNGMLQISKKQMEKDEIEDNSRQQIIIIPRNKELKQISDNTNQELKKISYNNIKKPYIIPSDKELDKMDMTRITDLIDKYTDHHDVLCEQQIRVGTIFDGGKHVCNDESIRPDNKNCLVYSIGSNAEYSFERDAIRWFGCEVHTFDPFERDKNSPFRAKERELLLCYDMIDEPSVIDRLDKSFHEEEVDRKRQLRSKGEYPKGCTHHDLGLSNETETRKNKENKEFKFDTLENIMKMLNHSQRVLDILKIDIEGEEWVFLKSVLDTNILTKHVKQITIELHFMKQFKKCLSLLRRLREIGFLVFSRERNTFCKGCTYEVPSLNRDVCLVTEFSYMNERFR